MNAPLKIWGLLDGRPGNETQVRGIVQALGESYQYLEVHLNRWAKLPNPIRKNTLIGLENKTIIASPYPTMVVSAGRKAAPIAHFIKKQHPNTKLVQLMSPELPYHDFDHVILPQHDDIKAGKNIILSQGAPHALTDEKLEKAKKDWQGKLPINTGKSIALLIGGNSKQGKLQQLDLENLITQLKKWLTPENTLWITTSRRTPQWIVPYLKENLLETSNFIYNYGYGTENPYLGYLTLADVIIVTGESVSMISEACYTGKPVYLFLPKQTMAPKHHHFVNQLIQQDFVKNLAHYEVNWKPNQKLDEANRLAKVLKEKI